MGDTLAETNDATARILVVLRSAWFGRVAFDAPALVPRLRGAAFEPRAPDAREDARGLHGETSEAGSLRRPDVRGNARGEIGGGRR